MADKEPDRESYYEAAADVWQRGCQGLELSEKDRMKFERLARDRFYTFVMSSRHAQVAGDSAKLQSLITSLAKDLGESPGLQRSWRQSEFSVDDFGGLVTALLPQGSEPN